MRNTANFSLEVTYLMGGGTAGLGSMLTMMADGLAYLFRDFYLWVAPLVGVVGSFISGSNTVSNTLFAGLQFETSIMVGLPSVIVLALQNTGGAIGNMICVNNVVSACATTGMSGNEGKIIRLNIIPCLLFWLLLAGGATILVGAFY
jgi:lactate permease